MSTNSHQKVVIEKASGRGAIVVKPTEFKGAVYVDVRNYYKAGESEELKPTQKGIMVPLDLAESVADAILAMSAAHNAAQNAPSKYYCVIPGIKESRLNAKTIKVSERKVFEDEKTLRASAKPSDGDLLVVFELPAGVDLELEDNLYVMPANAKAKVLAVCKNRKWASEKPAATAKTATVRRPAARINRKL